MAQGATQEEVLALFDPLSATAAPAAEDPTPQITQKHASRLIEPREPATTCGRSCVPDDTLPEKEKKAIEEAVDEWFQGRQSLRCVLMDLPALLPHVRLPDFDVLSGHTEAKKAYRRAILALHPDKQWGLPDRKRHLHCVVFDHLLTSYKRWAAFDETNDEGVLTKAAR
mmetsp:Transcript_44256/g.103977  ORF Transcript_44256/g.103977 Transcript_44256/m.103977 type:complete len:169 (+) Transcript_44256:3-509(+)